MTRITKLKIFESPRSQTPEEAKETFQLAGKELLEVCTMIEVVQEMMKLVPLSEVQKTLDDLRKGRYI